MPSACPLDLGYPAWSSMQSHLDMMKLDAMQGGLVMIQLGQAKASQSFECSSKAMHMPEQKF